MKQKIQTIDRDEQLKQRYRNAAIKKQQVKEEDIVEVILADGGAYVDVWTWIPKESL